MDYVVYAMILNNLLVFSLFGDIEDVKFAGCFLLWLL